MLGSFPKMNVILFALTFFQLSTSVITSHSDTFTEELLIKPLYSSQLYVHFQFATKWNTGLDNETFRHTHLFPRALGEILQRYNVHELHVSLTNGLWRYEKWGYPVYDAAPGAELWAWFREDTLDVDENWKLLANSLSGLLCASLNFVDASNSARPKFTFQPRGVVDNKQNVQSSFVRYSALPREIVCTENLTPWKKLLPCESQIGLASLLNSGYIHNTRYHSLALHFRPVCREHDETCTSTALELQQSVSLVYDYAILGTKNWSFRKLFGQGLMGACPLASASTIYVDTSSNTSVPFKLTPAPDRYVRSIRGGQENTYAKYAVRGWAMTLNADYSGNEQVVLSSPPSLYAHQYTTGYGQERGGIVTDIYNNHWSTLDVVVFQCIPWYVPVYLHTLTVRTKQGDILKPSAINYVPGRQRERPYSLEMVLKLPPRSVTSISIEFDYVFLKWQEYPPDANHGFYIGSAIVSSNLPLARNFTGLPQDGATIADGFNASRSCYLVQIRTENMVITLPTPDFSMPYNVICLACTVVALAFGPLHNITTKRLVLTVKDNEGLVVKVRRKLLKVWKAWTSKDK